MAPRADEEEKAILHESLKGRETMDGGRMVNVNLLAAKLPEPFHSSTQNTNVASLGGRNDGGGLRQ